MTKRDAAQALIAVHHLLSAKDQAFASSLLTSLDQNGDLSVKQWHWVVALGERATEAQAPKNAPFSTSVGDISRIVSMIELAKSKAKFPKILLGDDSITIRVSVAGAQAREPGSLTITDNDRTNDEGRKLWLGRVTKAGVFEPARGCPAVVGALLTSFAHNPEKVAREFARRRAQCCFCGQSLTSEDQVSQILGWGPVCGPKFGLPHSKAAAEAVLRCETVSGMSEEHLADVAANADRPMPEGV